VSAVRDMSPSSRYSASRGALEFPRKRHTNDSDARKSIRKNHDPMTIKMAGKSDTLFPEVWLHCWNMAIGYA